MAIKKTTKTKNIDVIDRGGAKTVAKKKSFVKITKIIFAIFSVLWIGGFAYSGLYVKDNYTTQIKESLVVSMFFDLQKDISAQYAELVEKLKDAVNVEKPIQEIFDGIQVAESTTQKVANTTEKASNATGSVKQLSSLAGKFGVDTGSVDKVVSSADKAITDTNNINATINAKISEIENEVILKTQIEVDVMIDKAVTDLVEKNTGALGRIMLNDYGIDSVSPFVPSSWDVAGQIYSDLEKSKISVVDTLIGTVNGYFNYIVWGALILFWAIGFFIWWKVRGIVKNMIAPFIVCPRCGHAFADKRTAMGFLKVFTPWNWI